MLNSIEVNTFLNLQIPIKVMQITDYGRYILIVIL